MISFLALRGFYHFSFPLFWHGILIEKGTGRLGATSIYHLPRGMGEESLLFASLRVPFWLQFDLTHFDCLGIKEKYFASGEQWEATLVALFVFSGG